MNYDYKDFPESFNFPMTNLDKSFKLPIIQESKTYFSAAGCTKHTVELEYNLLSYFKRIARPYYLEMEIPFKEPLKSSIRRFLISLEAYLEDPNHLLSGEFILSEAIKGPAFATYLKRVRFKSFLNTCQGTTFEKPDWWDLVPSYDIIDIGNIFNYQYLIHWEEDNEDYKYGFEELNIAPEFIKEFEDTLDILLSDTQIDRIDPREILLSSSGSICLNPNNLKKKKIYEEKSTSLNTFSKRRGQVKRCIIQVGPENSRDSVINNLSDLNKIKLIERQVVEVLQIFADKTVDRNILDFEKKYSKFIKNHKWFLCRDFTKEGITKPRQLLKAMLKILHKNYPQCEAFEDIDFFDDLEILFKDKIIKPPRGHGLGMANALTTLMQITIFEMTISRMETDSSNIHLLTHNDDAILGTSKRAEFEEYWDKEEIVLKGLGLLRNPKKSFFSKNAGVFIERYFYINRPFLNRKESYSRRELYMAYCAANITQAKQIISSQVYIDKDFLKLNLEKIITFWGYEFFPEEIHYPAFCGGWYNESIYNVSLDLRRLDELEYHDKVYRAYKACKHSKLKPKYRKGTYIPPVSRIFPLHLNLIEDEFKGIFDIGSRWEIDSKYSTLKTNPEVYVRSWEKLRKLRRQEYFKSHQCLYKDFIKEICLSSNKDFYPLDFMIEKSCQTYILERNLEDPYSSSNPLLEYLSWLTPLKDIDQNPWGLIFSSQTINSRLTANERKRLKLVFSNLSLTGKLRKDSTVLPINEEDFFDFQDRYFSPISYLKVMGELENPYVPLIKKEYTNKMCERKKLKYGFYLTTDQYISYSETRDNKNVFKFIIDKKLSKENIAKLWSILEKYEPKVQEIMYESPSDEEIDYNPYMTREGVHKYATPESYQSYLENRDSVSEKIKPIFKEVQELNQRFKLLSSNYAIQAGMYSSEKYLDEYRSLSTLAKWIYDSVYGAPTTEPDEEVESSEEEFNLFDE